MRHRRDRDTGVNVPLAISLLDAIIMRHESSLSEKRP